MQLYDSNAWKPLVQTLKNICPVTVMCCSKDGISVKDFDDKHIAMVSLHLRPDEFYCFDVPKKTKLGVDWSLIHKFIQSSSGPLLFEIKEEKLIIHFKGFAVRKLFCCLFISFVCRNINGSWFCFSHRRRRVWIHHSRRDQRRTCF